MSEREGWDWFPLDDAVERKCSVDTSAIAATFARCFSTPDGERVLDHLRHVTLSRAHGPDASDAVLRHHEGQRQLVLVILSLVGQGRAAPAQASPRLQL